MRLFLNFAVLTLIVLVFGGYMLLLMIEILHDPICTILPRILVLAYSVMQDFHAPSTGDPPTPNPPIGPKEPQ